MRGKDHSKALENRRAARRAQRLDRLVEHLLLPPPAVAVPVATSAAARAPVSATAARTPPPPPPMMGADGLAPLVAHFKVPHGCWLREATAVATDSADNVYVFNR